MARFLQYSVRYNFRLSLRYVFRVTSISNCIWLLLFYKGRQGDHTSPDLATNNMLCHKGAYEVLTSRDTFKYCTMGENQDGLILKIHLLEKNPQTLLNLNACIYTYISIILIAVERITMEH